MAKIKANDLGKDLCKAMGISDFNVSEVQIICEANSVARVEIKRYIEDSEIGNIKEALSKYEVVNGLDKS